MINILECGYDNLSYYFLKYIEQKTIECSKAKIELVNFDNIKLLPALITEMIFTLSDLMHFRVNSEYNKQELLKIILS